MEDLRSELEQLNERQRAYVIARSKSNSDSQALKEVGISPATFWRWDKELRDKLNDIAQRFKTEVAYRVLMKLQDNAEDAAGAIVGLLKSRNENVRIKAAQDILDRTIGKASQTFDVNATTEAKIVIDTTEILSRNGIDNKEPPASVSEDGL